MLRPCWRQAKQKGERVPEAKVAINGAVTGAIQTGLLVLLAVEEADGAADIEWLSGKIVRLRIFDDENGVMNLDVCDVNGEILLISQFTLHGDARKGRRPSYSGAEAPGTAKEKFEELIAKVKEMFPGNVETGKFQAMMDVSIINHGPVTILLDSKKLF